MKVFSANIQDLRTLYVSNLKKALDMEQKITKALPDLIEKASDPELVSAFETICKKPTDTWRRSRVCCSATSAKPRPKPVR